MPELTDRKRDHLHINIEGDIRSDLSSGFEKYFFEHQAMPEIDLDQVNLASEFIGRPVSTPLLISSMTGGTAEAGRLNRMLAETAQQYGFAIGLGSQRVGLQQSDTQDSFKVRQWCPDVLLFANLGAVQLNYGMGMDDCRRAVEMVQADALVLHLNPLQEALQPHGDTRFGGLLAKIEQVCHIVPFPVIVKEVGWGINAKAARQLRDAGVSAIDVAGAGGTSWSQVEMHRMTDPVARATAQAFRGWGLPTADCLQEIHQALPDLPLIASGGLRDGVDAAKSLALGASLAGFAGPFIRAAAESQERLNQFAESLLAQLRNAMFVSGHASVADLRSTDRLRKVD